MLGGMKHVGVVRGSSQVLETGSSLPGQALLVGVYPDRIAAGEPVTLVHALTETAFDLSVAAAVELRDLLTRAIDVALAQRTKEPS